MLRVPIPVVKRVLRQKIFLQPCLIGILFASVLLLVVLGIISRRIRPVLSAVANVEVGNAVTSAINRAVFESLSEEHISYRDMIEMKTDNNGRIAVLTSNLEQINRLRAKLLSTALDAVSGLSSKEFSIPLGNLTEIDILSGRGPQVDVRVMSTGTASADFSHQFLEAGVNQTLHQILLDIVVCVQILLPGETMELPVSTQICIAETIIVGEVPDTYLEWENGYQYGTQTGN